MNHGVEHERPEPRPAETADLRDRLEFLELTAADSERLRRLVPLYRSMAGEFVDLFYRHLFRFEETARFLHDPGLVEHLKRAQRDHFQSMFQARWDDEYVRQRRHVGHTHADIGVEPQFFLGAYTQFLGVYLERVCAEGRLVTAKDLDDVQAVLKAVFLDIGLTLDAYFFQFLRDLQQALDMVWQANRELRQFAQFTSHDLKTPLGTVANLCEEALDEFGREMPDEARRLIESARQTVFRMSSTIDELLSASMRSHETGSEDEVSSDVVIDEAVERVRPLLEKKRIELVLSKPFPRVVGNQAHLREAFYNLLSNAAKYIDEEPGRIEVAAELKGTECIFSVADTGPGIPTEERERIFAPFRRLVMHHEVPGSGLGLYFTRNLIEQQGGRVWVESEPGRGSCFYVLLRRASSTSETRRHGEEEIK